MRAIVLVGLCLLVAGCSAPRSLPPPPPLCYDPPPPDPVRMHSVAPKITELPSGDMIVYFTMAEYENLSVNLANVTAHLKQKNALILYYRDCLRKATPSGAGASLSP